MKTRVAIAVLGGSRLRATHALELISYFYQGTPLAINMFTPRCRPEFEADVVVAGILRYPEERIAVLNSNRATEAPERYLEMRLDCERASLRLSLGGVARLAVDWSRVYAQAKRPEFATATAEHLRVFLGEMMQPMRRLDSALEAREILRTVFAGYESARAGETVRL